MWGLSGRPDLGQKKLFLNKKEEPFQDLSVLLFRLLCLNILLVNKILLMIIFELRIMGCRSDPRQLWTNFFFIYFLTPALTSMFASSMAWLGFFPTSYAATGNQTRISSVAPLRETLTQDDLSTEQPRPQQLRTKFTLPAKNEQ